MKITVIGQPRSGTRLVARLLAASGIEVAHDTGHGIEDADGPVVLVRREEEFRKGSELDFWPMDTRTDQDFPEGHFPDFETIRAKYPDAPIVHYEDVISDHEAVIASLAQWLDVAPWSFDEVLYDANDRRRRGERRREH